jgi:nitrile hydratase beta subunit
MGGLHGFGAVRVAADEPVFHARWEARVFGIVQHLGGGNIDAGRHSLERLDPVAYLARGYYGRWLAALERGLLAGRALAPGEIEARLTAPRRPAAPRPGTTWNPPPAVDYTRPVPRAPAFGVGDAVRTRNHQPAGHTRLPAYARCRAGTVVHVHAAMVYPDDHAHGRGENPQHVYTVRFTAEELWGDAAEPRAVVHLDLFEPYLERG